jgi:MFS family permease
VLLTDRPLIILAVCVLLFNFANTPLLPLVGQELAFRFPGAATAMLSLCMIAAQGVMLPIAIWVGANADRLGRRPIFLVGLAALAIRTALYVMSDNPYWLLAIQFLDGVGAGVYEALLPLVIADVMRGTGRYNLAQGAVAAVAGVGAAISAVAAGAVVDRLGYSAAFLFLAVAAALAFLIFFALMPETRDVQPFVGEDEPQRD